MIQRIQTVYLLLAIVCMTCFQLAPLIGEEFKGHYEPTKGYDVLHAVKTGAGVYKVYFTVIFSCTAIGFALISIFLFKKRSIQQLFVAFSTVFVFTSAVYIFYKYETMVFPGDVLYTPWNALALVALILEVLAIMAIRKDEKAVQELNAGRLR
jgi:hypothetical protein